MTTDSKIKSRAYGMTNSHQIQWLPNFWHSNERTNNQPLLFWASFFARPLDGWPSSFPRESSGFRAQAGALSGS